MNVFKFCSSIWVSFTLFTSKHISYNFPSLWRIYDVNNEKSKIHDEFHNKFAWKANACKFYLLEKD